MRKIKPIFFLFILLFPLLFAYGVDAQTSEFFEGGNWVIDGNVVYVDDERVYIAVYPHTSAGGWVYLNFTSKRYEGQVDVLFGFDSDVSVPRRADLYHPHNVSVSRNYTIPERYFTNTTFFKANYTFASKDSEWLYNGEVWLWSRPNASAEWTLDWHKRYEKANKITKTVYWTETYRKEWLTLTKDKVDWKVLRKEYRGMNRWYYLQANIKRNKLYHLRIWLDVSPSLDGKKTKYWVAFKPSDESLVEAIVLEHFYALDPWYNSNWGYRKSHVINSASGAGTNYQVNITVHYGSGTDNAWDVYCDSKCRSDFGDIRFTASDGTTLLDYWIEEKHDSDNATFWVEITDNLTAQDATIYMYYGNPSATTTSNGDNTFIFFDHFTSLDTSKWTFNSQDGVIEIVGSEIHLQATTSGSATEPWFVKTTAITSQNHCLEAKVRHVNGRTAADQDRMQFGETDSAVHFGSADEACIVATAYGGTEISENIKNSGSWASSFTLGTGLTQGTTWILQIKRYSTTNVGAYLDEDRVEQNSNSRTDNLFAFHPNVFLRSQSGETNDAYICLLYTSPSPRD